MRLLNELFNFILLTSSKYGIDESHDVSHSMNVLHYAQDIYEAQVYIYPPLKHYERVIYIAALLHDMCDKKYMDEIEGLNEICNYLKPAY
jgi:HD superfamily phosphodiesterase